MASCQTERWAGTSPYVKLVVTENASTSTETVSKLNWAVYYISDYPASASARTYTVTVNGSVPSGGRGSYNIDGVTGTKLMASGTVSINKKASTQGITFAVSFPFNLTWSGQYKGTLSASGKVTVSAKPSYTITYNANGGSNAPGKQTKVYDANSVLSSGKPTKSGYIFEGWATTSDGTVAYQPGDTYSSNANVTLYAIWKQSTFTITYDANGGIGAPDNQIKTYGTDLTLSDVKPTKTDYKFVGWGTAAFDTTAKYQPGGTYTSNANIVLYAIWVLDYEKPRITELSVFRANIKPAFPPIEFADGGILGGVNFNWATDKTLVGINISVKKTTDSTWDEIYSIDYASDSDFIQDVIVNDDGSQTGRFASVILYKEPTAEDGIAPLPMDPDSTFEVRIKVKDSSGQTIINRFMNGTIYPIDFLNSDNGTGTAIGKAATLANTFEVSWPTKLTGGLVHVEVPSADLNNVKTPGFYASRDVNYGGKVYYSNMPPINNMVGTFCLEVYSAGNDGQLLQRFIKCDKEASATYERFYYENSWGDWTMSGIIDYNSSISFSEGNDPFRDSNSTLYLKQYSDASNRFNITCSGNIVTMAFRTASTTKVNAGTSYVLGTIPESFRPSNIVSTSGLFSIGTTVYNSCAIWVRTNGQICVKPYNTDTSANPKFYEANLVWDLKAVWNKE